MNQDVPMAKGRQFICSCGKNYLSYAALFTHIKQKHDGKAPGPIIRPRSERKRGRPRKNPQGQNHSQGQQSDLPENGISKVIDNNNIQKKEQEQQKTKKAAQLLLGTGGFVAFTAYKPEPLRSPNKRPSQSGKKILNKKGSFNQIAQRKGSSLFNLYQEKQQKIGSNESILVQEQKLSLINFCQNLQQINKNELKKIFEQKKMKQQQFECDLYDIEEQTKQLVKQRIKQEKILKKIGICPDKNYKNNNQHQVIQNYETVTLEIGLNKLLRYIMCILNEQDQNNIKNNFGLHDCSLIQQYQGYPYQFQQILLFFSLFLQFISTQANPGGKKITYEELKQITLYKLTDYMGRFIKFLQKNLQLALINLPIFRDMNHIKMMLFIGNWLVVKKIQYEIQIQKQLKEQQIGLQKQIQNENMQNQVNNTIQYKFSVDLQDLEEFVHDNHN